MSVDTFNKFRLLIHLIRVDYQQEENYLFFFPFFFWETYLIEKVISSSLM